MKTLNLSRLLVSTIACLVLIAGCANPNHQTAEVMEPSSNLGHLNFYFLPQTWWQKNTTMGGAAIIVDGKEVGIMKFGTQASLYLKPGSKEISMYISETYPLPPFINKIGNPDWRQAIVINSNTPTIFVMRYKNGDWDYNFSGGYAYSRGKGTLNISPTKGANNSLPFSFKYIESD